MADGRVSYTDDNSLELILNAVIRQFETEVQRDQTLGDDEKRYCCTKFAQSLRRTVWDNVCYNGDPLHLKESTERRVEVKGDEDEQLQHYNTVLYPQMNSLTVEVTRKRKHYPAECCQHLNVMYETELSDTIISKETTTNKMLSLIKDPILEFKSEQVLNLMKTTTLDMSAFDKNAGPLIDKAKRLKLAQQQVKENLSMNKSELDFDFKTPEQCLTNPRDTNNGLIVNPGKTDDAVPGLAIKRPQNAQRGQSRDHPRPLLMFLKK